MSETRYFNFPINLLEGFLMDHKECLSNILYYHLYQHSVENYVLDEPIESFKSAAGFYNISLGNLNSSYKQGKILYETFPTNSVKVGINSSIYWDYYSNRKDEFEKVCLLAFLALKSIIGPKPYCKTTNKFLLARMDGKSSSITDFDELSYSIYKYANDYQLTKIKNHLRMNWHLKYYGKYMRGFYVSFDMKLEKLVLEAEKKRVSTKLKQMKRREREAINQALSQLSND